VPVAVEDRSERPNVSLHRASEPIRTPRSTWNVAFTDVVHCHLGFRGLGAFKKAREHFEVIDPLEAAIAEIRYWAILGAAKHALIRFMGEEGEPVPTNYSRHARRTGLPRSNTRPRTDSSPSSSSGLAV
jgi:hypothetical protein